MENSSYQNYKGEKVIISDLTDEKLVKVYRFFLQYSKVVQGTLHQKNVPKDHLYSGYALNIATTRDNLRTEIKRRKLKMSQFKV